MAMMVLILDGLRGAIEQAPPCGKPGAAAG
jgi:hypothetical protein